MASTLLLPCSYRRLSGQTAKESEPEITYIPIIRVHEDGHVERVWDSDVVPPTLDPKTDVTSKDVVYSPENNLSLRLFIPRRVVESDEDHEKLPLVVYFHGGGFVMESAFSQMYHGYMNNLIAGAKCLGVSVQYRRAPEHPIPGPYDDSWAALKWVSAHLGGDGQEEWLNEFVDFDKVYLAGDSAGANIAHHMAMRMGRERLTVAGGNFGIRGIVLVHPYFWGKEPIDESDIKDKTLRSKIDAFWALASPNSVDGNDDPLINVIQFGPSLAGLGCGRVLVCVAARDVFARRGWRYAEELKVSGWEGKVEVVEDEEEGHAFHLFNPSCENALRLMKRIVGFINKE